MRDTTKALERVHREAPRPRGIGSVPLGAVKGPRASGPRRRFVVAGLVLAAALGVLLYLGVQGAAVYYLTPSGLLSRGESAYGEPVRLEGKVLEGSIQRVPEENLLRFTLTDGREEVPVAYRGTVPDAFEPGGEAVVVGTLTPAGLFEASVLLAKCPSKYEPAEGIR